jgi:hypothetical protein
VVEVQLEAVGHDVAAAPALRERDRIHRAVEQVVEHDLTRSERAELDEQGAGLVDRVLALPRARAVGGLALELERGVDRATRAEAEPVVARLEAHGELDVGSSGSSASTTPSSFSAKGPSSRA